MKKCFLSLLLTSICSIPSVLAQEGNADFMRSIGKIYVVVAVIVVVFVGLVAFLIYLERKLTKLENQINTDE